MVTVKPIRSEYDYEDALARLGEIFWGDTLNKCVNESGGVTSS